MTRPWRDAEDVDAQPLRCSVCGAAILDCATCRVHIGWRLRGADEFYGFVSERLV